MGGVSLNDFGYSRAVVAINTQSLSSIPFSYYYLNLDAFSVWSGVGITSKVSLYSYADDGLVTKDDYNKGAFVGTYDLTTGNHANGDILGNSYLDISSALLTLMAANIEHSEINIRTANEFGTGLLFTKPYIIASTERLGQPVSPISPVPLPAALPMFAASLFGLSLFRKRSRS
jgi:hypothetical protein